MHVDIRILFTHEKDQISKMASIIHHLILIIIHSAVLYGSSSKNPKDVQKAILDLLGLQQIPNGVDHWTDTDADIKMAPKYMLDLYEKYRDGRITRGKQVANTVRSIQAEVGLVRSQSMFVFNLTSILWSEKVLRAEIHVFKRRMKKNTDPIDIFMEMHELGPTYIRKLDHRRIPEASFGWQAADVTSAVQACRHRNNGLPRMLAIAFTTESKDGHSFEPINVKSLVRKISRPYLVIYSNDTQNITVDHIKPHLSAQDLTSSYVEPSTGLREKFSSFNPDGQVNAGEGFEETPEDKANMEEGDQLDPEGIASPGEDDATLEKVKLPKQQRWYGDNKFFQFFASPSKAKVNQLTSVTRKSKDKHHNEVLDTRLRRSVLDNEIPDSPEDEVELEEIQKLAAIESTHPKILQGRTKTRKHGQKHHDREEQQLIPYPKDHNAKNNRGNRKHRKNRRKNRRQRQRDSFRVLSQNDWDVEKVFSDSEAKALCSKRTFTLDFADIGWSQWIISPRSFEANFCAGTCPFPLPQKLKPSNHATIQSLVHAIGLTDKVPSPCCVPEKMSSITLLFFDESKNVVLKNYPDMSVESCACR